MMKRRCMMGTRSIENVVYYLGCLVVFAAFSSVAETQAAEFYDIEGTNYYVAVNDSIVSPDDWTWAMRVDRVDESVVKGPKTALEHLLENPMFDPPTTLTQGIIYGEWGYGTEIEIGKSLATHTSYIGMAQFEYDASPSFWNPYAGQLTKYPGTIGIGMGLLVYGAPIPEPSTAVLLGLGLSGLAAKGRRRNRS